GTGVLYGPGTLAGSLFADHAHIESGRVTTVRIMRASAFFDRHFNLHDDVFLKLNCEGAEVPIVEDLVASGWFARIRSVLLDLDARKIPSLGARLNRLLDTLGATDIHNWVFPEDVQYGQQCTFGCIHHWLRVAGAHEVSVGSVWRSGAYHMGLWREGAFR